MSVCGASWYDVSCVCFTIRLLVSICFHITYSSTQHVYKHTFVYKHLVLDILKKKIAHRAFLLRNMWQIIISLEVLQHHFWETHAFFKMPFSIGNYIHLWSFFGNELLYYKTQYSLKCCSILFWSFEQYMPFSRCLLQLGNAWLFDMKYNSFLGNVYIYNYTYIYINTFVWKNCFITIQIVPWSVAAILLKNGCLFQEVWFSWECNISQNIYFDLGEFI
jgi:hypothetical protein